MKRTTKRDLKPDLPDAGAFQRLTDFARRIVAVPKCEAEAKADAYRRQKKN